MKKGFTLIELMLVIVILGILTALITGNFLNSLKKGRDARRKGDLNQIQQTMELYYGDNKAYPTMGANFFGSPLQNPTNTVTYMKQVPQDPSPGRTYYYESDATGSYYKLYASLENELDHGSGVNQNGYSSNCTTTCKYGISSSNTSVDTTQSVPTATSIPVPTGGLPTSSPTTTPPNCIASGMQCQTVVPSTCCSGICTGFGQLGVCN